MSEPTSDLPDPIDHRSPAHANRRFAGPATWAAIRDSYLAGVPAPTLERRYGVKAATIWKRAQRQGWLHGSGQGTPAAALTPLFPVSEPRPAKPHPEETAHAAARAADRAMRDGRLDEALKLARIAKVLGEVARVGV